MQSSVAAAFVWYLSDGLISFLEAQVQLAVDRSSFRYFCFLRSHIGLLASQHLWKNLEHLKKLNRRILISPLNCQENDIPSVFKCMTRCSMF